MPEEVAAPEELEVLDEERIRWVLEQFADLPVRQKEVLKLRYFDGLSTGAIAERMRVSEPTVATHHARALETLKARARGAGWMAPVLGWLAVSRWKAAAAAAGILAAAGGAAYFFTPDPSTHLIVTDSVQLKGTVVVGHPGCATEKGKNLLYCATFQLAWDELKKLAGGRVQLDKPVALANLLNKGGATREDVPEGSLVAMAVRVEEGAAAKINGELQKTFGQGPDPFLERIGSGPGLVAYTFLSRDLKFRHPFAALPDAMEFRGSGVEEVKSFGFKGDKEVAEQVRVYGYKTQNDPLVVTLQPEQDGEEILLAQIPSGATLAETIQGALRIREGCKGVGLPLDAVLQVPMLDFDLRHDFRELVGRRVAQLGEGAEISGALQTIRFKLDEKGAVLRSRAQIEVRSVADPEPEKRMILVFNRPFLILLKRKDRPQPYFALWVDNPELLVAAQKP